MRSLSSRHRDQALKGIDAKRIYEDLQSEVAFEGSYASVHRFVKVVHSVSLKRVWWMEVKLGEEVQIDYGTMVLLKARMIATSGANCFGLLCRFRARVISRRCFASIGRAL